MLSFIPTGAGYQHSMVHGHKNEQRQQQHEIGRQWVSIEQGPSSNELVMFASPTRAPKVGRLHLTSYGPTIICNS